MAWLSLASASSAVDALVVAVCSIATGQVFPDKKPPGMNNYGGFLGERRMKKHLTTINRSPWFLRLRDARNLVVHRGFWPVRLVRSQDWVMHRGQSLWDYRLGEDMGLPLTVQSKNSPLDLGGILSGLFYDLEQMELAMADDLKKTPFRHPEPQVVTQSVPLDWGGELFPRVEVTGPSFDLTQAYPPIPVTRIVPPTLLPPPTAPPDQDEYT